MIIKYLFLFVSVFSFTFAIEDTCPSLYCNSGYYISDTIITTKTFLGSSSLVNNINNTCLSNVKIIWNVPYSSNPSNSSAQYFFSYTRTQIVCSVIPTCEDDYIWDSELHSCIPQCPVNAEYSLQLETCSCIPPYISDFSDGELTCITPDCPPFYEDHNPPLPLFNQTDDYSKCDFYPLTDGATFSIGDIVCCYGQKKDDHESICSSGEIEINGVCYPVDPTSPDTNETSYECPLEYYWSFQDDKCMPFYPDENQTDPDGTDTGDTGGTDSNDTDSNQTDPDGLDTGDTGGTGTDGADSNDTDSNETLEEKMSLVDQLMSDVSNLNGIKSTLTHAVNNYALVSLPVTVSGSCSRDFRKTFTIFGKTYTFDMNSYMQPLYDFLPMLKAIYLFLSVYLAISVHLSKGE